MAQSSNAVGTYTDEAKAAIQAMLGVTDLISTEESSTATIAHTINSTFMMNGKLHRATAAIAIGDTVEVGTNCEVVKADEVFVKNTDYASNTTAGVVKIYINNGIGIDSDGRLKTIPAGNSDAKAGGNNSLPITPFYQHSSVFYGLAKAAGDSTQSASNNAVGTYTNEAKAAIKSMIGVNVEDVQIDGTSVVSNGVANIPLATATSVGVVYPISNYGLNMNTIGGIYISKAADSDIKTGTNNYKPIVPVNQHIAIFYGLAKAAGDTTQSASSNAVGVYTDNAKASIKSMLGIVDGSTGTVSVTGTTPTITAVENTRYVCGEVSTLSFTPPASGISIVRFTSGTTATALTLPSTVKFPEWFNPTTLETDTIYEICITDGIYGAVMSWAQ